MKKKILSAVLALCLAFGSAAALPQSSVVESTSITASAEVETKKSGNYEYTILKDGTAEIAKYTGKESKVTIPQKLGGKKVTSIGIEAFYGNKTIKSMTIPEGVTTIGAFSFNACENLTDIKIPKSVNELLSYLSKNPFVGTKWLADQEKKNPMVIVNDILIEGSKCKGDIVIPDNVKKINGMAFYWDLELTGVTIPKNVKIIGHDSFRACYNLTKLKIQDGVKSIESCAFIACTGLKSVEIPDSVKTLEGFVFDACLNLESIALPNGMKRIGDQLLAGCTNLKTLIIPEGVTGLGYCSLPGNLTTLVIPSTFKEYYGSGYETIQDLIVNGMKNKIYGAGYRYVYDEKTNTSLKYKIPGFTIHGLKGSEAEKYAKKNGFKFVARNTTEPKVVRYAGSDRAETATKISKAVNAKTSDTVILATGFDFHDALAAVPLASAYNAPLLLADRDNLSAKTLAEIKRLKAKNVIVVASTNSKDQNGKDAAIRNNVYKQLKGYKVTKLVGSSYYETAKNVAKNLKTKTGKNPTSVFITTDKNYADALSASPVAAILNAPIIYVKPTGALDSNTKNYLASIKKSVKDVYIVGGVNAVSKSVEKSVLSVLGKKSATRFAGDDRYATCIKINDYFKSTLTGDSVCIAKGYNFPDALAGGVFAAKQKAPLFLADKLDAKATISKTQANYLYIKNPSKLYIFGGETAVPTALVKTIAKASV